MSVALEASHTRALLGTGTIGTPEPRPPVDSAQIAGSDQALQSLVDGGAITEVGKVAYRRRERKPESCVKTIMSEV